MLLDIKGNRLHKERGDKNYKWTTILIFANIIGVEKRKNHDHHREL